MAVICNLIIQDNCILIFFAKPQRVLLNLIILIFKKIFLIKKMAWYCSLNVYQIYPFFYMYMSQYLQENDTKILKQ